ncbi:hypothetical protein K402DRAFT_397599 [Aulographum hederae CBS 113979]|uniref:Uncharacterized protein n=1 Tax=Aulographum hederae CBS 113979 TaxID=1176131 RepID=A0A6G1GN09_9PEZI|nr:hypothetical protein K402DRAFT_397599 [Aulographum hederae CBS 113979]
MVTVEPLYVFRFVLIVLILIEKGAIEVYIQRERRVVWRELARATLLGTMMITNTRDFH